MLFAIAQMHDRTDKLIRNTQNTSGENDLNDKEYSVEALFPDCNQADSLFAIIKDIILSVDSTIEIVPRQNYVTFKLDGKKNLVALWPRSGWIEIVLNAKLNTLHDSYGLIYDISNRKWSSEQYALKFFSDTDTKAVKDIIMQTCQLKK